MTPLMFYDDDSAYSCPRCHEPDCGVVDKTNTCACGVVYARARYLKTRIIMLPAHFTSPTESVCHHRRSSVYVEAPGTAHATQFGPAEPPTLHDVHRVATFGSVRNIKNVAVDFSSPPMVSIIDMLGYAYSVPWRAIQSVEGILYFLDYFTAGGSLLWPDDYAPRENDEVENDPATWAARAYPGSSLNLRLRDPDQGASVHERFVSKIKAVLETSIEPCHEQPVERRIEKACLEMGASESQAEFRRLIKDAITSSGLAERQSSCVEGSRNTMSISRHTCLICCRQFPSQNRLAQHAHPHLVALRCPSECALCDATDLPFYIGEDVDRRAKACEESSTVSRRS